MAEAAWRKQLEKKHGSVFTPIREFENKKPRIIPVSPNIDRAIGGIMEGTWNIFSGKAKCGKTTTAMQIARNAQKLYGKKIFYGNVEGRFKHMNLQIEGLDLDSIELIESKRGNILSAEKHLEIYCDILKNEEEVVLIIDSTSALCASSEMDNAITASTRNNGPKLLASFCRQMASVVPVQGHIILLINHLIANTSGYGSPFMEDGGNKIQYQKDTHLRCKSNKFWTDKDGVAIGQEVTWEVICSSQGPPGAKPTSWIRYGKGLDSTKEIMSIAMDLAIINKAGAWMSYTNTSGEEVKLQGEERLYNYLEEHPEDLELIENSIKELTG